MRTERPELERDPAGVHLPRVRALDGLRGVAVLAVVVFHFGRLTGGYLGVDLFFVLSGFLITSLLLAKSPATAEAVRAPSLRIAPLQFWTRRARRLLPAVLVLIAVVGIVAALWS